VTRSGRLYRDGIAAFALLALTALFAAILNNRPQAILSGDFNVVDGDSPLRNGERLRLLGIDAPEYRQQCERDGGAWPCGQQARASLVKFLQGGLPECRGNDRDRYDRRLVTCRMNGGDLNGEMVRRGMAVSFGSYGSEEIEARVTQAGMWAGSFERPQEFRREQEAQQAQGSGLLKKEADFIRHLAGLD
jgi:endonuclease YncB( thermonuclease family)